ncbi:M56 family metallopeptidase [Flavobacterium zepuense]|uniref:M56 family metallopeptidase n=1 Tax=Flavobacterium zepuense TaxID=2593302 RepID=A0A552VAR5_9FLAO|nr:M56 family metallopeptidase [Flavobacterium zepuense]TRW27573.1 M56 family metallopeptidase [Flavobacterium zepuense]
MEALTLYLLKASCLVALFFVAYYFLLRKETFFAGNRRFLLAGLGTAILLPLLVYTKTVWVTPALTDGVPQKLTLNAAQTHAVHSTAPVQQATEIAINWQLVGLSIYAAVLLVLLSLFLKDIIKLRRMLSGNTVIKQDGFLLIDSAAATTPFSFFRYIVYNSSLLQPQELESIIAHEKVHSSQRHSLDMIISELFCIALWFNPFVWLYKKAISQNLEFIADAEATKLVADRVAYQKTLLKITIRPERNAIINHFYQSLIKKRIIMLNKKQSERSKSLKYAAIVPVLAAFAFAFQYRVVAREKNVITTNVVPLSKYEPIEGLDALTVEINKDLTEAEFSKLKALFKKMFDADLYFTKIARNSKGEITSINVTVKDKDHRDNYPVREILGNGTTPITTFTVGISKEDDETNNIFFAETTKAAQPETERELTNVTDPAIEYLNKSGKGLKRLIVINGVVQQGSEVLIPKGFKVHGMTELEKAYAVKKYGKAAKDGAVEITTVATKEAGSSEATSIAFVEEQDAVTVTDLGYIIKKDSQEEAFKAYQELFKEDGITMTYDGIKRNAEGYITCIHIKLKDNKDNVAEGTWEVKGTTTKPIQDIYVGTKKGLLVVMGQK